MLVYVKVFLLTLLPVLVMLFLDFKKFSIKKFISYFVLINFSSLWIFGVILQRIDKSLEIVQAIDNICGQWKIIFLIDVIIMILIFTYNRYIDMLEKKKINISTKMKILKAVVIFLFFLGCIFYGLTMYFVGDFDNITPEQIIFNFLSPLTGMAQNQLTIIIFGPVLTIIVPIVFFVWWFINNKEYLKNNKPILSHKVKMRIGTFISLFVLIFGSVYMYTNLSLGKLIKQLTDSNNFIETHYVSPNDVVIENTLSKPRNVIHLYLESMETTYLDKANGGYFDYNLMPELTKIAQEESTIVFSNDNKKIGGATQIFGSSWSIAGMVNASSGVPLKIPMGGNDYGKTGDFLPGLVNIYDILQYYGYNQMVMIGADAKFGGFDALFKDHGNFEIFDVYKARQDGYIPSDYNVNWGFEDKKLFSFAKEQITRLSQEDKLFNFVFETADTHFPDGYVEPEDPRPYDEPYANAIYNSDRRAAEFIRWCQKQSWYKNTTIVVHGDHLSMDTKFFKNMDPNYSRKTFNMIINSANQNQENIKNRTYAVLDYMPTILSAMGYSIEGDRLGLGTNLFSGEKTLLEKYGFKELDNYLTAPSRIFDIQFLNPNRRIDYIPKKNE